MKENEEVLKKRYIYEVVRRLPKNQREEVAMELEELIGDMYESNKGSVEEILIQLGSPKEFARKYYKFNDYLIGPEYFGTYWLVIKIALISVGITSLLSEIVEEISNFSGILDSLIDIPTHVGTNLVSTFGVITIIFYIIEHTQLNDDLVSKNDMGEKQSQVGSEENINRNTVWKPSDLKPVPNKKEMISRVDSIIGLIVITIFGSLLIAKPSIFSAYFNIGDKAFDKVPMLNLDKWGTIVPFIAIIFLSGIVDEIVKLITGRYCKLVLLCNIITNSIFFVFIVIVLKYFPVFNPDFANNVAHYNDISHFSKGDILYYWGTETMNNIIIGILLIITIAEIGFTTYKTIRYSTECNGIVHH